MTAYTLLTDSVFQTIMMLPKEPWLEKVCKYMDVYIYYFFCYPVLIFSSL